MPLSTRFAHTTIPRKVVYGRIFLLLLLACVMMSIFSSFAPTNILPRAVANRRVVGVSLLHNVNRSLHVPFAALKRGLKIMPLGDSITAGDNSYRSGGYRVELWKLGQAAGWQFRFVGSKMNGPNSLPDRFHEGHSGWRIDQISAKVIPWLKAAKPDIVLLHIGTNDLRQGYSVSVAVARLNTLIDQITTTLPDAIVLVAQITPQQDLRIDRKVIAYNAAIPQLINAKAEQGAHIEYVDMYDAVPIQDVSDRIHPNNAGYALMAQVWYKVLIPIIEG